MISGSRYQLTLEINRHLRLAADIGRAQTEISTGKRIQAPSDDPVAAARVSDIARTQANEAVWLRNLRTAGALSSRADTVLAGVGLGLDRAKELMIAAANGTLSPENRASMALELRSIAEEILSSSNATDGRGQSLFPSGEPILLPVSAGISIAAVGGRSAVFEGVAVAGVDRDITTIVFEAAAAIEMADRDERAPAMAASLEGVEAAARHIIAARGEQGARGNQIDNLVERLVSSGLQLEEERSAAEGTDVIAAIARLQARQLTLQAAQSVFARVNQTTLFDLLR